MNNKNKTPSNNNNGDKLLKAYYQCLREQDFKTFAGFCRIYSDFSNDFIFLRYDNWTYAQKQFHQNRSKKDIVLKPRRIGFTTLELARDLFFALTNPGSTVMIVAQEYSLAKKAIQDIKNFISYIQELEKKICTHPSQKLLPKITLSNVKEIVFETNSRIVGEVAKNQESAADRTGRGTGITRLHCTEVAFWSYPDLTMKSLMIAAKTASEIVIESTPNGANGYFFDTYYKIKEGNMPGWKSHFYPWHSHEEYAIPFYTKHEENNFDFSPRDEYEKKLIEEFNISKQQLNWWRQSVSEAAKGIESMLQEFPIDEASCFRIKSQTFLEQSDFEYLENSYEEPSSIISIQDFCPSISIRTVGASNIPSISFWKGKESSDNISKRESFVIGADTSYGREQDSSSFCVIDHLSGEIVATFADNKISPRSFAKLLAAVGTHFNNAQIAVEVQASGQGVIDVLLNEELYTNLYKHSNKDYYGWNTTTNTRTELFNLFQKMVKEKDPKIVDINIVAECRTLIFSRDNKIQHAKGAHDDRLMSFMIAQKVRQESPVTHSVSYVQARPSRFGLGENAFSLRSNNNNNREYRISLKN